MSKIREFLGIGIDKTLDSVKNVITTFVPDKGLQQQINAEIDRQANELKLKQLEVAEKAMEAEVADKASAREMYKESIKSDDVFIRRFPMILAASTLALSGILLIGMLFMPVPDTNRDIINISLGTLLGGGLGTIIQFFFGSSYEKKHKQ
jgi:hypothetical protein